MAQGDGYRVEMENISKIETFEKSVSTDNRPIGFQNDAYDHVSDEIHTEHPLIMVRNATKSYKSLGSKEVPKVLCDFNMTVPKGAIYSLLGSSGSGKTTALNCILGLRTLDKGEIKVFGDEPNIVALHNIGYMPQDLCLYEYLTIVETLKCFGQIYGMDLQAIEEGIQFLVKLLNLEDVTNLVSTLSGGQKRRASFGIALLHKPQLLILDEPTVGVDPVLRQRIWDYLKSLTDSQNVTVVITTHYIEEARQSHMIGLMGEGKLLYENPPGVLLRQTGSRLLADAVLQVYIRHENQDSDNSRSLEQTNHYKENVSTSILNTNHSRNAEIRQSAKMKYAKKGTVNHNNRSSSKIILSLLKRNFIQMMRNLWYLSFLLILPAVQVLAAVLAIGGHPHDINFGVVNYELRINESQRLGGNSLLNSCKEQFYSCRYLKLIPEKDAHLHFFQSEEKAIDAMKDSSIAAFVVFPVNFTSHMKDRILFNNFAENYTLDGSQIELRTDTTDTQVALRMTQVLMGVLQKFIISLFDSPENDARLGMLPLNFSAPIYGAEDISHQSYIAPGLIVSYATFFSMSITAMQLIGDINGGTMERTLVAGVTKPLIMSGELITQAIILSVQTGLMYFIVLAFSEIKMQGSILLSVVLAYLNGIVGIALGFTLPLICKREIEALLLASGLILPDVIVGGLCWPVEFKAKWITYLSYGLPHTFSGISMRSIFNRGWGLTHSHVWPGFVWPCVWILCAFVINLRFNILSR